MNDENERLRVPSTWRQIQILTRKNLAIFTRKKSLIIFHITIVLFLFMWIKYTNFLLASESVMFKTEKYDPYNLPEFKRCSPKSDCTNLGIIYFSEKDSDPINPWITDALESIKKRLNLNEESDIKVMYKGDNLKELGDSFDQFKEIKSVLLFCNKHKFMNNASISFNCDRINSMGVFNLDLNIYGLIYNQTALAPNLLKDPNTPMKIDTNAILLKKVIDESIIQNNRFEFGEEEHSNFELDIKLSSYPKPKLPIFNKFDSLTVWASFHYMFLILLSFTQFVKIISQEKQNSLRKGLEPYGLSAFSYWISWILFALILNGCFTLIIAIIGYFFNALTFTEVPFLLVSLLLFSTMTAYSFLAIVITTCCDDYRSASKVAYTIFIASLFLQIFFSQNTLTNLFFWEERPISIAIAQWVLMIFPSFPFTIICNNMHFQAGYHMDIMTMSMVKGNGYDWETYLTPFHRDIPMIATTARPADFTFQLIIFGLILIYSVLIYIFDHKIESNRGHKAKFIRPKAKNSSPTGSEYAESLIEGEEQNLFEIKGITKVYRSLFRKTKTFNALEKVHLSIRKNETIALLGENGAGKSTLISILSGVIDYTNGQIFYNGKFYDPQDHQKLLISVCPQYDLLWKELTVYENLYIIGQFKGINPQQIKKDIKEILMSLNLKAEKHTLISNLSGGMKRRASVGMALLGNSELVIFDEPTTGLDPINRKAVWQFIEHLKKKGKTILLTTHIMDEADFLADRIAIINRGKILKVDRSIDIKNMFKIVNVIFSLKNYSEEFNNDLREYFECNFAGTHTLKYHSEKRIKYNVINEIKGLRKLVNDFEGGAESSTESRMFDNYIDSFEIAVLDLEEAYIMVNEESEKDQSTME